MCGRARCTLRADDIPRACRLNGRPIRSINTDRYRPSYNVSPGRDIPVIRREDGSDGDGVVLQCMKWGLIPSFTKKDEKPDHYKMFNARAESIREKASFRRLVPNNRCVVAVEGFYEWKKDGSKKQPYYIHLEDGRPLVFAALYDTWKNSEGEIHYTFTILTTLSSSTFGWLHDRMPVILGDKESMDTWLFGSPSSKFETVLKPYERPDLVWYPVTSAMGKPSFDGPECVMEATQTIMGAQRYLTEHDKQAKLLKQKVEVCQNTAEDYKKSFEQSEEARRNLELDVANLNDLVKGLQDGAEQTRAEGRDEGLQEGIARGRKEMEEEMKKSLQEEFDRGYAQAEEDAVDQIMALQAGMKEEQHKKSFMLGFNAGLDEAGVEPADERRDLMTAPPLPADEEPPVDEPSADPANPEQPVAETTPAESQSSEATL